MCYHTKPEVEMAALESRFKAKFEFDDFFSESRFNGFSFPMTPVIARENPKLIKLFSWGLMPSWSQDLSFRVHTLNARIETLGEKPSFRDSVNNRCWVLVAGFYEWKWIDGKGRQKQQFEITLPDQSPFAMAGIYSPWTDKSTGEIINTYSIVTTEANPFMAEIHNSKKRMPVVLTPENEGFWLGGEDVRAFGKCDVELQAKAI